MHPNPIYRPEGRERDIAFARARGFGVLTVAAGDAAPMVSHLPFILSADGTRLEGHVVRSNPIARALRDGPRAARMVVSGPDAFISPDWYGVEDQVPTWNYIAVHLAGRVELAPPGGLRDHLSRLSETFEAQLAPKPIWRLDKVSPDALEKLERMILPADAEQDRVCAPRRRRRRGGRHAGAGACRPRRPDARAACRLSPVDGGQRLSIEGQDCI
jgi:transcriptional regulator